MEYQSLYRQYRPNAFTDVIGQGHIIRTLMNSITQNKVAHAYLFTGPRGTGKTSTAKIFAKALNCINGPTDHPCNTCEKCLKIINGSFMDVIEIDAASNRGINEIRDLREKVKFAPSEGIYKVYIIDEVHMLTTEAFNALLKTLEEPPSKVVFILATTDPQDIPPTVISRCQRFDFKVLSVKMIMEHLSSVARDLGGVIDEKAAEIIAIKTNGGMRDALSIFEQCLTYDNHITKETVQKVVGITNDTSVVEFASQLLVGNTDECFKVLDDIYQEGNSYSIFIRDLINLGKDRFIMTRDEKWRVFITNMMRVMTHPLWNIDPRLCIEINCIPTNGTIIERVEEKNEGILVLDKSDKQVGVDNVASEHGSNKFQDIISKWPSILDAIKRERVSLRALVVEGVPTSLEKDTLILTYRREYSFHKENLSLVKNRVAVESILTQMIGYSIKIYPIIEGESLLSGSTNVEQVANQIENHNDVDSLINEAIKIFGGKLTRLDNGGVV